MLWIETSALLGEQGVSPGHRFVQRFVPCLMHRPSLGVGVRWHRRAPGELCPWVSQAVTAGAFCCLCRRADAPE